MLNPPNVRCCFNCYHWDNGTALEEVDPREFLDRRCYLEPPTPFWAGRTSGQQQLTVTTCWSERCRWFTERDGWREHWEALLKRS